MTKRRSISQTEFAILVFGIENLVVSSMRLLFGTITMIRNREGCSAKKDHAENPSTRDFTISNLERVSSIAVF